MKGFNQVTRVSAVAIDDLGIMDPLSLFAVEKSTVDTSIADPGQHSAPPTSEDSVRESSPMAAESNLRRPQRSWNTVSPPPPPVANESSFSGGSLGQQAIESFPLYSGEYTIISLIEATVQVLSNIDMNCALFMTNYRLVFLPFDQRAEQLYATVAALPGWLQVPLSCIDKLEREKRPRDFGLSMCVHCKDCRQLRVVLKAKSTSNLDYDVERAYNVISAYAFPNNMRHLFAYSHKIQLDPEEQLRQSKEAPSKDLLLEFARIGILESPFWRISQVNSQFKLCGTYPTTLAVPSAITDDELFAIAAFRSGHRLPALCWAHPVNLASLWRSSQPKVGKSGSCGADERMLDIIAKSTQASRMGGSDSSLFIVDCRSRASAMANYAAGAGYESQSNYPNSRLEFFGIPNIHAVRDSLKSLTSVLLSTSTSASSDINFSKQVEDSSWLSNLRLIIRAGWETASALSRGVPVLVHCSHGWDRTAQVCCIAEIMLDPFYRTFEGFPVLIEKEWCSFGHPFQMRCGHGQERSNGRQDDEVSPIFLQFLDCLFQLHKQCMHAFEFNSRYILAIAEHIYSGRFGNFLFNCDHDRAIFKSIEQCADIWTYMKANSAAFSNPLYLPSANLNCGGSNQPLPFLSQLLRGVSLWSDFFLRYSSALSVPPLPDTFAVHLAPKNRDGNVAHSMLDLVSSSDINLALSRRVTTQFDNWEALCRKLMGEKEDIERRQKLLMEKLSAVIERIDAGENDGVDDVIGQLRSCLLSDNVDPAPQSVATVVHFTMPTSGTTSVSDKVTPPDRTLAENEVEDIII